MRPGKVCTRCWRDAPCPIHTRPKTTGFAPYNASRTGANHAQHVALRRQLLKEGRGHQCERCGRHLPTQMHHDRPQHTPEAVRFLCHDCHRNVDSHAR